MTDLLQAALELYEAPFKFQYGYIYDAKNRMVADDDGQDVALRVRGWGRISNLPNPEQLQDTVGELIAQALTEFWRRKSMTDTKIKPAAILHNNFGKMVPMWLDETCLKDGGNLYDEAALEAARQEGRLQAIVDFGQLQTALEERDELRAQLAIATEALELGHSIEHAALPRHDPKPCLCSQCVFARARKEVLTKIKGEV